jgi:hypothetical protein
MNGSQNSAEGMYHMLLLCSVQCNRQELSGVRVDDNQLSCPLQSLLLY